ncbi:hypothetical protein PYCCODRAFT_1480695 [Trametes coccinea BRFM310]|uniref:Protein kinase domain-containing protein n=1 Tax=Trametes coccinea (strain BRFM310) TaxID=1353009 RepID=A0A1Y2IB47_TRAC3|nr:hypothetical protein PYCCODRAFT_1480695 [Trametes coccinea BRFM310]
MSSQPTPPRPSAHAAFTPPPMASHSSSDASTVKVPSPLNPSPSPKAKPLPLPPAEPSSRYTTPASLSSQTVRPRGASVSTIKPPSLPSSTAVHIARVVSNPPPATTSSTTFSPPPDFRSRSRASSLAHRGRSASPFRDFSLVWRSSSTATPPNGESTSWWTKMELMPRPWQERRQRTVPHEQTEGWVRTRHRVGEAAVNVLGVAGQVAHELLELSADVLRFAPVVGLEEAARTLLNIWDALQLVDINRLACLRLTERCATILISVREEIAEAGDDVGVELQAPVHRLVESFKEVHRFLVKQSHRPFIKRYLQRDEIQRALVGCHNSLTDAMGMFSLSIQIRILKQVLRAEEQRRAETAAILDTIRQHHPDSPPQTNSLMLTGTDVPPIALPPAAVDAPEASGAPDRAHVLATLQALTASQNERDMAHDAEDLRQLMRAALQANSDVEMIRILQVGRDEMPEAIKTLQRALEAEVERERESQGEAATAGEESVVEVKVKEVEVEPNGGAEVVEVAASLSRSATVASTSSEATSSSRSRRSTASRTPQRDTLDREFIETGIDALRRVSGAEAAAGLPSWTITRYEVDREEKIGLGFWSDVYRGWWKGRRVAIKVLAETTPRQLFVHEVSIWKTLQHPNVLELLGASSASSDPPWFFVSPYLRNGSLVSFLKGLPSLDHVDVLKMVHEIAKGMAYLHSMGVLHGDLKAANVLVDDKGHCVISDFGQSEMKSEAYRISGMPLPHGTLRWQAPELMSGQSGLTQEVDVYAFAITCVEILTKGAIPWPMADDDAVRHFVLRENVRPEPPLQRVWSLQLAEMLHACWHRDPAVRPPFAKIDHDVRQLRARYGSDVRDSPIPPRHAELEEEMHARKSPDMHPIPLPLLPPDTTASFIEEESVPSADTSYRTAVGELSVSTTAQSEAQGPLPASSRSSSRASSSLQDSDRVELEFPRHVSPPPPDEQAQNVRNERRYRMLLQHEFHPSLTLPLWTPSQVPIGAVGYHSKARGGEFVVLFNSFDPPKSSGGLANDIPNLYGYGRVVQGNQRQDKRNVAQRGMDMITSWLSATRSARGEVKYSRRYSSPLRAGHKTAHLFTEATNYRYIEDLGTPKKWFKANVDRILALYGKEHAISKEDLYLVIGTLEAQDYALFVSHEHPDGQVDFNVFAAARAGQPWGEFSFSFDLSSSFLGGPSYDEPVGNPQYAQKVSRYGNSGRWESVLLARLRFKPDQSEPTSL